MQKVREKLAADFPDVSTYLQAGGLVDSVVNQGKPTPIDIQIGRNDLQQAYAIAQATAAKVKQLDSVNDVLIPQDLNYPGLELNINRERAGLLGILPRMSWITSSPHLRRMVWIRPAFGLIRNAATVTC